METGMKARALLVSLCVVMIGTTAACGSSPDQDTPAAPAPAAPSASAPPSAAPSQSAPSSAAPAEPGPSEAVPSEPAAEVVITISDFEFEVPDTIPAGAEVTIVNEDSSFHTVTADDGAFDVDAPGGESVTFTAPDEPGEYAFHCTPHPNMTATLVIG